MIYFDNAYHVSQAYGSNQRRADRSAKIRG